MNHSKSEKQVKSAKLNRAEGMPRSWGNGFGKFPKIFNILLLFKYKTLKLFKINFYIIFTLFLYPGDTWNNNIFVRSKRFCELVLLLEGIGKHYKLRVYEQYSQGTCFKLWRKRILRLPHSSAPCSSFVVFSSDNVVIKIFFLFSELFSRFL